MDPEHVLSLEEAKREWRRDLDRIENAPHLTVGAKFAAVISAALKLYAVELYYEELRLTGVDPE